MGFSTWLADKRKRAQITQRSLARKCAVTPAYIAHLENGTSEPPPLKTCKALARGLGIRWEEVWQLAFQERLKRWLRREGYANLPENEIENFVKRIQITMH